MHRTIIVRKWEYILKINESSSPGKEEWKTCQEAAVAAGYFKMQRQERAEHGLDTVRERDMVRQEVRKTEVRFYGIVLRNSIQPLTL